MTASKPPFWSRPIAPLLLGIGACAACCAAPIAAIVIGAGAAGTIAFVLEPLAGVLLALAAVMAGVVYVRRRRAHATAASCETSGACSIDQSCGCGPSPQDRARSIGCTLEESEMPRRLDSFRSLFQRGLKARRSSSGRAEWTFAWSPALEAEARELAAAEQGCCSFFQFDIERHGDELRWITTATGPKHDAVAMLDGIAATVVPSSPRA